MTDLEFVLLFAWIVTLCLWQFAHSAVRRLRGIIIAVGLEEAHIEVDQERHTVRIIHH